MDRRSFLCTSALALLGATVARAVVAPPRRTPFRGLLPAGPLSTVQLTDCELTNSGVWTFEASDGSHYSFAPYARQPKPRSLSRGRTTTLSIGDGKMIRHVTEDYWGRYARVTGVSIQITAPPYRPHTFLSPRPVVMGPMPLTLTFQQVCMYPERNPPLIAG